MTASRVLGRYALYDEIAHGGMATVHFGRLIGPVGFARTVAIKRLHAQYAKDPEFVSMFLDEARLAARIRHPNVIPTLDVVAEEGELFLVMEYVQGESLSRLLRLAKKAEEPMPLEVLSAIVSGALQGLHAAHEATSETGDPLGIVHRDISPQNVIVGVDGVARVLDFGIAKAAGRLQTTKEGQLKGKIAYMPPEQIQGAVTRRTDIYAVSVMLWEALTMHRLFHDDNPATVLANVLGMEVPPPSQYDARISPALDALVLRGLSRDPRERFATAKEMAKALEQLVRAASTHEVGEWVEKVAGPELGKRKEAITEIESEASKKNVMEKIAVGRVEIPPIDLPGDASSVTLAGPASAAPKEPAQKKSPALLFALSAIVGLLGVISVLLFRQPATTTPTPASSQPPPAATSTKPSADPVASTPPPVASPAASPAPTPTGVASQAAPKPTVKAPTVVKAKANCDPPYEYDSAGKKHYKPDCF
jgi:serine/threonine-protein kinase